MKAIQALTEARSAVMRMTTNFDDFRPELRPAYRLGFEAARIAARDLINQNIAEHGKTPAIPALERVCDSLYGLQPNSDNIEPSQRPPYRHGFAGGRNKAVETITSVLALHRQLEAK